MELGSEPQPPFSSRRKNLLGPSLLRKQCDLTHRSIPNTKFTVSESDKNVL